MRRILNIVILALGLTPYDGPGASGEDHWAFRPCVRPELPAISPTSWGITPVDRFIAREHQRNSLTPMPEASRELLVRRLYLDLIGIPPSEAELNAVERDTSHGWYERLVDQLLSDPRHGERWARHWMDVWRYSDWWGLGDQLRNSQKHLWHWRDWIIESLNANAPYDEMVREMLAADELHPNDLSKLRATGFLARDYFLFNRNQWMEEVVEHVSKGFLGLTMNCAKCHDHKYDPVAQIDFYKMRAFFEPYHARLDMLPGEPDLSRDGLPRVFDAATTPVTYRFIRGDEGNPDKSAPIAPGVPTFLSFRAIDIRPVDLPAEAWQPERRPWVLQTHIAAAQKRIPAATATVTQSEDRLKREPASAEAAAELEAARAALSTVTSELASAELRASAIRSSWQTNGAPAQMKQAQEARETAIRSERKVAVARKRQSVADLKLKLLRVAADKRDALTKELNEATQAVEVAAKTESAPINPSDAFAPLSGAAWTPTRFLSSTADDPVVASGSQSTGRRSALAEWITDPRNPLTARVAVNQLWMRHMGTPLVATVFDFGHKGTSPTHPELLDWLASELVSSGWDMKHLHRLIVSSATYRMGSSVKGADANMARDPDNRFLWHRVPIRLEAQVVRDALLAHAGELDLTVGGPSVPSSAQADSKRRSLYFYHSNNDHNLFLSMFDDAGVKECYRRNQSIVPQQAMALTNSRLVNDAAPAIAARLSSGASRSMSRDSDMEFTRRAFRLLLGNLPNPGELEASLDSLDEWLRMDTTPNREESQRRARAHLVWALLNHNDFVTLR